MQLLFRILSVTSASALRLDGIHPGKIAWFHAPGTARSFATTIARHANSSLPMEARATERNKFFKAYPAETWFRNAWPGSCDTVAVDSKTYYKFKGRFVGMFRQPEQRVLSAHHQLAFGAGDVLKYAKRVEGSVTKQLAGQEPGDRWILWPGGFACGGPIGSNNGSQPKPALSRAIKRLREGFQFVGLSEEYDFSVCLFHAMFGGQCLPSEFEHMRPRGNNRKHDLGPLQGYKDGVDGKLYEEAKSIFWHNMAEYKVTRERCEKEVCPEVQGVFNVGDGTVAALNAHPGTSFEWYGRRHALADEWE